MYVIHVSWIRVPESRCDRQLGLVGEEGREEERTKFKFIGRW